MVISLKHVSTSVLFLVFVLCFFSVDAQRKKNNNKVTDKELSDDEKYQSEFYFIEGEKFFLTEDYAKSLEMFSRSLEVNPNNGAAHYKIAEIYMKSGELIKALPSAMKCLELDPSEKYYYLLNATLQTQLGNYPAAAGHYESMFARFPGNEDYLYDLAMIYQYSGDYDLSIETYRKVEDYYGKQVEVTREIQKIYLKQGKLELVKKEWEALLSVKPEEALFLEYADFLISREAKSEAKQYIEEAIKLNPDNPRPYISLSDIYRLEKDFENAIDVLTTPFESGLISYDEKLQLLAKFILELPNEALQAEVEALITVLKSEYPDNYQSYAIAGDMYYKVGNKQSALENYQRSVQKDETNFNVWQNIISIENERANYDSVIAYSNKALEVFPNQAVLYFYEGSAYLLKKDYKMAIAILEQGAKYAKFNQDLSAVFFGQLGDAYNGIGDHAKSDKAFDTALKSQPNNEFALNNYSYYLSLRNENLEKALKMSSLLIEGHPDNPTYLDTHAWVLYKLGKLKESKKYLERATQNSSASGIIFEHYGDVLFKLGQKNEAIEQWEKARVIGSASKLIDKKIADRKLYE